MKHLSYFLLPAVFAVFNVCHAQLPDYYVYLVKGNVNVLKTNEKGQALKQGDFLFNADALAISKNSEVTLANRNAEYFVLNTPGNIKVNTLAKTSSRSYTGVTKKYLHLVWEEVLDPNYDFTKFKSKNLTGVYGGVSRGNSCDNLIFPINGLKTSQDSILFKWHKTSPLSNYSFLIYDNEWNEAAKMAIKDTQLTVSTTGLLPKKGKYYWLIKSEDGTCEEEVPLYFEIMSSDEENKLIASIIHTNEPGGLESGLETIDKLEKNAFIYAAKAHYADLIKDEPDNEALVKTYVIFLLNYGFDEDAGAAWSIYKK